MIKSNEIFLANCSIFEFLDIIFIAFLIHAVVRLHFMIFEKEKQKRTKVNCEEEKFSLTVSKHFREKLFTTQNTPKSDHK